MKKKIDSQSQINKILNRNLNFCWKVLWFMQKETFDYEYWIFERISIFFFLKNVTNIEVDKCREQI